MKIKRKTWPVFFLAGCLLLLTGCRLRTYHLYDPGVPSQVLSSFLDAVIAGNRQEANEMLYQCVWTSDSDSGLYGAQGDLVSETDLHLLQCINESRHYEIVSESDYDKDAVEARVTVTYTVFNVPAFQSVLSSDVVRLVKEEQYNGKNFETPADTVGLIEERKAFLLQSPQNFYTTDRYIVTLVRFKGRWRVVLSEDFYNALCGCPADGGNYENHQ